MSTAAGVCVCVHCSRCVCVSTAPGVCVCVCVSTAPGVCVCVCVCPLLQVCVCVSTAPGVCVCVCVLSTAPGVCVCVHCSRCVCVCPLLQVCVCVCTWMGQMQKTRFTAGYTLYNCVCDKKKYRLSFFFKTDIRLWYNA